VCRPSWAVPSSNADSARVAFSMPKTIGVISDTHGLLRPEAVEALGGCDSIIHAGDVGTPEVLEQLRQVAPVAAVRGNVDNGSWALSLPPTLVIEFERHVIHVRHILSDVVPVPDGISAVVYGHSHKPSVEDRGGVLYLNPGSAGPRRFRLPVTVARMSLVEGRLTARIIELDVAHPLRDQKW
jgi:putative phosphoesterase